MKTRFRLIRRGSRGGAFYCVDCHTGKRTSLQTSNEDEAIQIIQSKNQAEKQPALNLQIAKAYLAGTDSGITTRTWQNAIEALTATKQDANQARWKTAAKDHAIKPLLPQLIVETKAELILSVLRSGTVSTNVYLRRLHNFCVDMNWLPWPIVPKRQATAPFTGTTLYLRVALDFTGNSGTGFYSSDGITWTQLGSAFNLAYDWATGTFQGEQFALFCYNAQPGRGYVDVDWFRFTPPAFINNIAPTSHSSVTLHLENSPGSTNVIQATANWTTWPPTWRIRMDWGNSRTPTPARGPAGFIGLSPSKELHTPPAARPGAGL